MINKKCIFIFLFILLILLVAPVGAEPPFSERTEVDLINPGIVIVSPQFNEYEISDNITLNFDILNSTYYKLDNSEVECSIDSVNQKGKNYFSSNLSYDSSKEHWYYEISDNISIGAYSYYVHCDSIYGEQGFISNGYRILNNSPLIDNDLMPISMIIIIPLFMSFIFLLSILVLGEGHGPLKVFLFVISFISVSVSYNYAIKIINLFYSNNSLVNFIAQDYTWYGYTIYIFIVYFIIYWIIQALNMVAKQKVREFNFEDGKKK